MLRAPLHVSATPAAADSFGWAQVIDSWTRGRHGRRGAMLQNGSRARARRSSCGEERGLQHGEAAPGRACLPMCRRSFGTSGRIGCVFCWHAQTLAKIATLTQQYPSLVEPPRPKKPSSEKDDA